MKRFAVVCAIVLGVSIFLGLEVHALGAGDVNVLGMPAVHLGSKSAEPAWLAFGGKGVLVLGAGFGLVEIGMAGVGVFFAVGQAAVGLFAVGQLAVGLVGVIGQLAFGATGIGQLAVGGLVEGQGKLGFSGGDFLRGLNADLDRFLRFR
jgi:hypothetical protein